jgi:hypothetical protein
MADRYWRGGAGTWNSTNTANWSETSGGAGGFSVPTSADDVYFNSDSDANSYIVTTSANNADMVCKSLNVSAPLTGTLTFSNTVSSVNIYGNLVHAGSGINWGGSVGLVFASTLAGNTITTNGFSFTNSLTFNGNGGEWTLQDALTIAQNRGFTLQRGVLNLNDYVLTCGLFLSNFSTVRVLNFGIGKIVVTGNNTFVITGNANGLTTSGSKRVELSYSGSIGTRNVAFMTSPTEETVLDYYVLGGTDIITTTGNACGARNLDFTGFAGTYTLALATIGNFSIYGDLTLSSGMSVSPSSSGLTFAGTSGAQAIRTNARTVDLPLSFDGDGGTFFFEDALTQGSTKTFTITNGTVQFKSGTVNTVGAFSTSGTNAKFLESTTSGSQATLSKSTGVVSVSNLVIQDSIATGGATWNAFLTDDNIDAGNNIGWDFLAQSGRYMYTRRKNKRLLS